MFFPFFLEGEQGGEKHGQKGLVVCNVFGMIKHVLKNSNIKLLKNNLNHIVTFS